MFAMYILKIAAAISQSKDKTQLLLQTEIKICDPLVTMLTVSFKDLSATLSPCLLYVVLMGRGRVQMSPVSAELLSARSGRPEIGAVPSDKAEPCTAPVN